MSILLSDGGLCIMLHHECFVMDIMLDDGDDGG